MHIKGAFDRAWWLEILKGLKDGGISEWILALIKNCFRDRKVTYRDQGEAVTKDVERGVPQGSVIRPTLWNVVMAGFLKLDIGEGCETFAYADDGVIIVRGIAETS